MMFLWQRIAELTIPSADNGERFYRRERLEKIEQLLEQSPYRPAWQQPLARIYRHHRFQNDAPALLLSCHIDSLYDHYHVESDETELRGTFDNSACNAVLVELMRANRLPPQALISFTGDEEGESRGVDQTLDSLSTVGVFERLELAITLDLTAEDAEEHCFTIENCFVESENTASLLRFDTPAALCAELQELLPPGAPIWEEGEADESWQYDEYDLNCFSFCLPCRLLGDDMHDQRGMAIAKQTVVGYAKMLERLVGRISARLEIEYRMTN